MNNSGIYESDNNNSGNSDSENKDNLNIYSDEKPADINQDDLDTPGVKYVDAVEVDDLEVISIKDQLYSHSDNPENNEPSEQILKKISPEDAWKMEDALGYHNDSGEDSSRAKSERLVIDKRLSAEADFSSKDANIFEKSRNENRKVNIVRPRQQNKKSRKIGISRNFVIIVLFIMMFSGIAYFGFRELKNVAYLKQYFATTDTDAKQSVQPTPDNGIATGANISVLPDNTEHVTAQVADKDDDPDRYFIDKSDPSGRTPAKSLIIPRLDSFSGAGHKIMEKAGELSMRFSLSDNDKRSAEFMVKDMTGFAVALPVAAYTSAQETAIRHNLPEIKENALKEDLYYFNYHINTPDDAFGYHATYIFRLNDYLLELSIVDPLALEDGGSKIWADNTLDRWYEAIISANSAQEQRTLLLGKKVEIAASEKTPAGGTADSGNNGVFAVRIGEQNINLVAPQAYIRVPDEMRNPGDLEVLKNTGQEILALFVNPRNSLDSATVEVPINLVDIQAGQDMFREFITASVVNPYTSDSLTVISERANSAFLVLNRSGKLGVYDPQNDTHAAVLLIKDKIILITMRKDGIFTRENYEKELFAWVDGIRVANGLEADGGVIRRHEEKIKVEDVKKEENQEQSVRLRKPEFNKIVDVKIGGKNIAIPIPVNFVTKTINVDSENNADKDITDGFVKETALFTDNNKLVTELAVSRFFDPELANIDNRIFKDFMNNVTRPGSNVVILKNHNDRFYILHNTKGKERETPVFAVIFLRKEIILLGINSAVNYTTDELINILAAWGESVLSANAQFIEFDNTDIKYPEKIIFDRLFKVSIGGKDVIIPVPGHFVIEDERVKEQQKKNSNLLLAFSNVAYSNYTAWLYNVSSKESSDYGPMEFGRYVSKEKGKLKDMGRVLKQQDNYFVFIDNINYDLDSMNFIVRVRGKILQMTVAFAANSSQKELEKLFTQWPEAILSANKNIQ